MKNCVFAIMFLIAAINMAVAAVSPDRLTILAKGVSVQNEFELKADLGNDLAKIQNAGFRHVRVFVDIDSLTNPAFIHKLDRLVIATNNRDIGLILCMVADNHPWIDSGDDAETESIWTDAWKMVANRYRMFPANHLYFEMANEPQLTDSDRWNAIQERLRTVVRKIVPSNTLLLVTSPTQLVSALPAVPSTDPNVVYTWHLYQPLAFTHQGATWLNSPNFPLFAGLSYPPDQANIDTIVVDQTADDLARYAAVGAALMQQEIDIGSAWSKTHQIPLMVTEFGVFGVADPVSRANWLREARTRLEAGNQGWTVWEYDGGFGIIPLYPPSEYVRALGLVQ